MAREAMDFAFSPDEDRLSEPKTCRRISCAMKISASSTSKRDHCIASRSFWSSFDYLRRRQRPSLPFSPSRRTADGLPPCFFVLLVPAFARNRLYRRTQRGSGFHICLSTLTRFCWRSPRDYASMRLDTCLPLHSLPATATSAP